MPSNQRSASSSRSRKSSKGPNKQQIRAAEVRARQSHESVRRQAGVAAEPVVAEAVTTPNGVSGPVTDVRPRSGVRVSATGRGRAKAKASAIHVHKLTREQEYSFIKADLKRLLVTAGALAAVMVVLLFVIEM